MENDLISRAELLDKIDQWANQVKGGIHPTDRIVWDVLEGVTDTICDEEAVEAEPKWISVKDGLPENEQMVIGYTPCDGYMFVGYYVEMRNWKQWYIVTAMRSTKYMTKRVTHWMPLPEPPKEEHHAD